MLALALTASAMLLSCVASSTLADEVTQTHPDVQLDQGAFLLSGNLAGSITLTADAYNGGNATATGYKLAFYDGDPGAGGTLIGRKDLTDIAAEARTTVTQSWSATAGLHQLYARLENTNVSDPAGNDQVDRQVYVLERLISRAGPDRVADPGENVTFNGSSSSASGGSIVNYTWDFGDGNVEYGAVATHAFANTGTALVLYNVTLTVRDGSGSTATDTSRAFINPSAGSAPSADAGTAPSGQTRELLAFNGSGSLGNIVSYEWDFGDGSTGTGVAPGHTYWDEGVYQVSLVVVNNVSVADGATISVSVSNRAPVVSSIGDVETDLYTSVKLLALAYDMDGYVASYRWDFGDGSTASTRGPSHAWSSDGPHQARLDVTDDDGDVASVLFFVNVTNVDPVARFTSPSSINEGSLMTVDGSASSDAGGDIVKYEWDWDGDGTWDNTTGPVSRYTYYSPGLRNVTLRVTDGEGATNTTMRAVNVLNVAPTARGQISPSSREEGMEITFSAAQSTEPGSNFANYSWDWTNDGTWDLITTEPVFNFSFTIVGTYTPRLGVYDEDGTYGYYSGYFFRFTITNLPPLVNETMSYGTEGEITNVTVDAYEPGNDLADFYWDFNGDDVVDAHTTVPYANWTFWRSGVFSVWVNVTDIDHDPPGTRSWGAGEVLVNISDVAPRPSVASGQATEGEPQTFTVDLQGTEQNISLFAFDLDNDGEYEVESTSQDTDLVFTKTGDLKCRVKVVDTDGSDGMAFFNVFVTDVAPIVWSTGTLVTAEGQPLRVEVEAYEPGMDIETYGFDWNGDGVVEDSTSEPVATHVFNSPGVKLIQVFVVDIDGSSGSTELRALVANTPPTADAGTPPQAREGEEILLSASNSSEPGDNIVQYEWDYDGDGLYDFLTNQAEHHHAWMAPGHFIMRLRVTDADGTFGVDTVSVEVVNVVPVAAFQVTLNPEDRPSLLDASGSHDPGGIHSYQWRITALGLSFFRSTTDPVLPFAFTKKAEYTVTLTVFDPPKEGTNDTATRTIVLGDVKTLPPTVTWYVPEEVWEGKAINLRAEALDPYSDDFDEPQVIDYRWEFGDGDSANGPVVTHVYSRARATPATVTLTVTDEDGDRSILAMNVTILNPPPVISPVEPIIVKRGDTGSTVIEAEDATSAGQALDYHLGVGTPDWLTLEADKLVVSPKGGVQPATYIVTVRVVDTLGAESQVQVPVVVLGEDAGATEGVTWGPFLGVLIVFMVVFLVLAVLIAKRMRPTSPPPPATADQRPRSPYDELYEAPPKRVRGMSKVERDRIAYEMEREGDEGAGPTAPEAVKVPEPPPSPVEPEPEPSYELPSWMTPKGAEPSEAVELREKEVAPPPSAPPEWTKPADRPTKYQYRPDAKVRYRGAGPPKQ